MKEVTGYDLNAERYFRYFENSIDAGFVADADGKYLNVNPAACRLLGYSKEELLNMSIKELVAPEELDKSLAAFEEVKKTGSSHLETILMAKSGTPIPVLIRAFKIFEGEYVAYCHDISERKKNEKILKEAKHLFSLITNNMLDVITIIDKYGKIIYASPSYTDLLGYNPQEMLGKNFFDYIHPHDIAKFTKEIELVINKKQFRKLECRFRHAKNSYVWLEIIGTVSLDTKGQVEGGILCSRDIGQRKFAEEMLRASEERYRKLVELLPDGILVCCEEIIVFANKFARVLLGVRKDQTLVGREYKSIIHPDCKSLLTENFFKKGSEVPLIEGKYIKNNGEPIDVEITGTTLYFQGQPAKLIVFRDITERKRSEAHLEETRKTLFEREKMAIIGQMSAAMAHEIRNPLTSIRGYAQLLKIKDYDKSKINTYLDIMIGEIDRANSLISDFLQLARPKETNLKEQSIVELINEFMELFLPYALLNNIEVTYETQDPLLSCLLDKNQIMQVLLNIGKNAVEAMDSGGKLKIVSGYDGEKHVFICLEDNGQGIPEDMIPKLGVPFFTTKEKGTGLGLSTCYSIIAAHGGYIDVKSTVGKGSSFTIYLPAK